MHSLKFPIELINELREVARQEGRPVVHTLHEAIETQVETLDLVTPEAHAVMTPKPSRLTTLSLREPIFTQLRNASLTLGYSYPRLAWLCVHLYLLQQQWSSHNGKPHSKEAY